MGDQMVACFATVRVSVVLRADTAARVGEALAAVTNAAVVEPVVFTVVPPGLAELGQVGAYLLGAVDVYAGVGALRYTNRGSDGASSWHTIADRQRSADAALLLGFRSEAAVPVDSWREAVAEFAAGGGARPACVRWRPVEPGPEDALTLLAGTALGAIDRLEAHRRPAGVPAPGSDLAGPDPAAGPVDEAMACGHLRAAAGLLADARYQLSPVAGQDSRRVVWADSLARIRYAADQLIWLVPDTPGQMPRRPDGAVATGASVDQVRQQFETAAGEVAAAGRRLRAALDAPMVPGRAAVVSAEAVVAAVPELLRAHAAGFGG
jgi:hypothetical protein